jgi:superfamily II DNA or RNA helicase
VNKLKHYGIEAGIIMSGVEPDDSKIVQVAAIQTLSRREHPEANLIIIDECHHAKAASYKQLWTQYPNSGNLKNRNISSNKTIYLRIYF